MTTEFTGYLLFSLLSFIFAATVLAIRKQPAKEEADVFRS